MDFPGSEEDGEDDLKELFADGHLMCNKEYERKLFKNAILLQTWFFLHRKLNLNKTNIIMQMHLTTFNPTLWGGGAP